MLGKISHTDDAGLNNDFWHATRFRRTRQSFFEELECLICSCPTKFRQGIAMRKSLLPPSFRKRKTSGRSNSRISRRIRPERQEKNFCPPFPKPSFFPFPSPLLKKHQALLILIPPTRRGGRWPGARGESQGCPWEACGRGAFQSIVQEKMIEGMVGVTVFVVNGPGLTTRIPGLQTVQAVFRFGRPLDDLHGAV